MKSKFRHLNQCHARMILAGIHIIDSRLKRSGMTDYGRFFRSLKLMKWLFIVASLIAMRVYAQGDVETIHKLLHDQVEAWNRGDIEGFMQGYWNSDSTEFVSGGSILHGWKNVLERYKKNYGTREKMGKLEFGELMIRMLSPTSAVAQGVWKLYRANDQPWGRFTLIIEKKLEGRRQTATDSLRWKITHDHTSSATKTNDQ